MKTSQNRKFKPWRVSLTERDGGDNMEVDAPRRRVHLEVRVRRGCASAPAEVRERVLDALAGQLQRQLLPGRLALDAFDDDLVADLDQVWVDADGPCAVWEADLQAHAYRLNEEGSYDETSEDDPSATVFTHWELPAAQFDGLWESLMFESGIKNHLLEFAASSLHFSARNVDHNVISWNHVVLLHGPPGTGKTSLCQALAQKLSIRLNATFTRAELLEINSHSLFSKWFSESGKLVGKLFSYIHELAEESNTLVCILIDEVESLAAARSAAVSGTEPSDSIRVVNALLTQIDKLKSRKNVIILTTSNITEAIDLAFVDRADIRQYIGLPPNPVRRQILLGCVRELSRVGILEPLDDESMTAISADLDKCAEATDGLSGRALRKLPFQAHARFIQSAQPAHPATFVQALLSAAKLERASAAEAGADRSIN